MQASLVPCPVPAPAYPQMAWLAASALGGFHVPLPSAFPPPFQAKDMSSKREVLTSRRSLSGPPGLLPEKGES